MHHIPAPTNIKMRCHGKTAVSAGLGAAGRRIGPDIRRDWIQKTGKRTQKDSSACLLGAHGRCRRVGHRETTRMTLHAAARLPGYRPRPVHGSPRHSRNRTIAGLKPMRHLEPWLPSSCAPRMIILANCFWLCSKAFDFWETYRLPSFLHEAPTGTQE